MFYWHLHKSPRLILSAPVKTRDSNRNADNDKPFHVTFPYSVITVIDKG